MLGLHGGTPVQTSRHDIFTGGHAFLKDQECDVEVIQVVQTNVTLWAHYLFYLQDESQCLHLLDSIKGLHILFTLKTSLQSIILY